MGNHEDTRCILITICTLLQIIYWQEKITDFNNKFFVAFSNGDQGIAIN
jgi:hypothetical protein